MPGLSRIQLTLEDVADCSTSSIIAPSFSTNIYSRTRSKVNCLLSSPSPLSFLSPIRPCATLFSPPVTLDIPAGARHCHSRRVQCHERRERHVKYPARQERQLGSHSALSCSTSAKRDHTLRRTDSYINPPRSDVPCSRPGIVPGRKTEVRHGLEQRKPPERDCPHFHDFQPDDPQLRGLQLQDALAESQKISNQYERTTRFRCHQISVYPCLKYHSGKPVPRKTAGFKEVFTACWKRFIADFGYYDPVGKSSSHYNVPPVSLFHVFFLVVTSLGLLTSLVSTAAACSSFSTGMNVFVVVISLPTAVHLDKSKTFATGKRRTERTDTAELKDRNATQIEIYDLAEVPSLLNTIPCQLRSTTCLEDEQNTSISCESISELCLCPRGYRQLDNYCIDEDECLTSSQSGDNVCSSTSVCENLMGSYACHCQPGFYHEQRICKGCSSSCPIGHFESSPCTLHSDRVCSPCKECDRHEYELRPCLSTRNRVCLHVAHPLLLAEKKSFASFLEGLRVEASENVFLENLQSTRHMDTTYYVTDTKQLTDFFWYRESGAVRINIGLTDVNVVPVYEDADHVSDNDYVIGSPPSNEKQEKDRFNEILRKHCRNPLPDHYSLMLEVTKERTTRATTVTCTYDRYLRGSCPYGVSFGESYIERAVNEPCEKLGTYPGQLNAASNSIVCTSDSSLLRDVFNVTPSYPTQIVQFPSKKLKTASARCDLCLQHDQCQVTDEFERSCCQIDCHVLSECKQASAALRKENMTTECATGEAYRYTLQPIFTDTSREFRCHIKHRPPDVLYHMWFYISVAGTTFETPHVHREVRFDNIGNMTGGRFQTEFLTIEHTTGMQLHDELILVGSSSVGRGGEGGTTPSTDTWSYSVRPLPRREGREGEGRGEEGREEDDKPFVVKSLAPNIHVTSTQFSEPFGYSSSSWGTAGGGVTDGCDKDVSKFLPSSTLLSGDKKYGEREKESEGEQRTPQEVSVMTMYSKQPYVYLLKSLDNPPHLKFTIPANASVLSWWFRDKNASLIRDDSLDVTLAISADTRLWEIQVLGRMRSCPAYLNIIVNDRLELEELFKQDLLISCPTSSSSPSTSSYLTQPPTPTDFNISFVIPNWRSKPEKTFDLILDDSTRSTPYRVFLTHLTFDDTPDACNVTDDVMTPMGVKKTTCIIASIIVMTTVVMACTLIRGIIEICSQKRKHLFLRQQPKPLNRSTEIKLQLPSVSDGSGKNRRGDLRGCWRRFSRFQKAILVVYVTCHMIRCLFFTFTAISIVLILCSSRYLAIVSDSITGGALRNQSFSDDNEWKFLQPRDFPAGFSDERIFQSGEFSTGSSDERFFRSGSFSETARDVLTSIEHHVASELERQATLLRQTRTASDNYIDDLTESILRHIRNVSNALVISKTIFSPPSQDGDFESVIRVVKRRLNTTLSSFQSDIEEFVRSYGLQRSVQLRRTQIVYRSYIRKVVTNAWFTYPQSLFNKTSSSGGLRVKDARRISTGGGGQGRGKSVRFEFAESDMEVMRFLGVQEVETVGEWQTQFDKRFVHELKKVEHIIESLHSALPDTCFICHQPPSSSSLSSPSPSQFPTIDTFLNSSLNIHSDSTRFYTSDQSASTSSVTWLAEMTKNRRLVPDTSGRGTQWGRDLSITNDDDINNSGDHEYLEVFDGLPATEVPQSPRTRSIDGVVFDRLRGEPPDPLSPLDGSSDISWISAISLRVLFLVLDLMLLTFRVVNLYANVRRICLGYERNVVLKTVDTQCFTGINSGTESPPPPTLVTSHTCSSPLDGEKVQLLITPAPPPLNGWLNGGGISEGGTAEDTDVTATAAFESLTREEEEEQWTKLLETLSSAQDTVTNNGGNNGINSGSTTVDKNIVACRCGNGMTGKSRKSENHRGDGEKFNRFAISSADAKIVIRNFAAGMCCFAWRSFRSSRSCGTFALAAGTIVGAQLAVRAVSRLMSGVAFTVSGVSRLMGVIELHATDMNSMINGTAAGYTTLMSHWYRGHVVRELGQLMGVIDFLNMGSEAVKQLYSAQLCALRLRPDVDAQLKMSADTLCNRSDSRSDFHLPLVPCNFVPVQPKFLSDCDRAALQSQLTSQIFHILSAFSSLTILAANILLISVTASLVFRSLETLYDYCLEAFLIFPVQYNSYTAAPSSFVTSHHRSDVEIIPHEHRKVLVIPAARHHVSLLPSNNGSAAYAISAAPAAAAASAAAAAAVDGERAVPAGTRVRPSKKSLTKPSEVNAGSVVRSPSPSSTSEILYSRFSETKV